MTSEEAPSHNDLKNATIEAIFWWKNIERFYHYQFKEISSILDKEEKYQEFFILKFFNPFLKEYSVRRNIKKGDKNVLKFLFELKKLGFFDDLEKSKEHSKLIDKYSDDLSKTKLTNGKNCKSLLSKIAFTISPDQFYIYDSLAKSSLWEYQKEKNKKLPKNKILRKELDKYHKFYDLANSLKESNNNDLNEVIKEFHKEINYSCKELIKDDYKALKMRIIDKHLWIKSQKEQAGEFETKNHLAYADYNKNFPLNLKSKRQ